MNQNFKDLPARCREAAGRDIGDRLFENGITTPRFNLGVVNYL